MPCQALLHGETTDEMQRLWLRQGNRWMLEANAKCARWGADMKPASDPSPADWKRGQSVARQTNSKMFAEFQLLTNCKSASEARAGWEIEREGDSELCRRTDSKCGCDFDEWERGVPMLLIILLVPGEWQIVLKDINGIWNYFINIFDCFQLNNWRSRWKEERRGNPEWLTGCWWSHWQWADAYKV